MRKIRQSLRNRCRGEALSEFAAAIAIFVCCLLPPLINLCTVTFRYVAAYALISDLTHKASLSDTRTQAMAFVGQEEKYRSLAQGLGFKIDVSEIQIVCKDQQSQTIVLPYRRAVPKAWLPGGAKGQCQYFLQTQTPVEIPPLVSFNPKVPGLSGPIDIICTNTVPWENLGVDPVTQQFYINE